MTNPSTGTELRAGTVAELAAALATLPPDAPVSAWDDGNLHAYSAAGIIINIQADGTAMIAGDW